MIPKSISLSLPWDDQKVVHLERMLTTLFGSALQMRTGTYTGDGTTSKTITLGIKALFITIMRKEYGNFNVAFAIREIDKYTYIPTSGIVADVITFTTDGIMLGNNANVNQAGKIYAYFAIG